MTDSCKMTLAEQAVDRAGPLQITIFAPPEYCVDPTRQTDMGAYNGEARITNTGQSPVRVTHASGNTAFRAFRSVAVWQLPGAEDALRYSPPPLAAAEIESTTVALAPGQSLVLKSWSRHQDAIENAMIGDADRPKLFVVEYAYNFEADGRAVTGSNKTKTVARLVTP